MRVLGRGPSTRYKPFRLLQLELGWDASELDTSLSYRPRGGRGYLASERPAALETALACGSVVGVWSRREEWRFRQFSHRSSLL